MLNSKSHQEKDNDCDKTVHSSNTCSCQHNYSEAKIKSMMQSSIWKKISVSQLFPVLVNDNGINMEMDALTQKREYRRMLKGNTAVFSV